jgi:hypothetical protein
MKQFSIANIDRKAEKLMKEHVENIVPLYGEFKKQGDWYYTEENEKGDYVSAGYYFSKKLLTKVYNFQISLVLQNIDFDEDFSIESSFKGMVNIKDISFKVKGNRSCMAERLNKDKVLKKKICDIAKHIDLTNISLKYSMYDKELKISINPYAGAFIWLKFPPVFYGIRLKESEYKSLYKLLNYLKSYLCQKSHRKK